jgi:PAS domain-containing protein
MRGKHPEWLATTVNAVRDLMLRRLTRPALDEDTKREAEMAVQALDLLWEQLEGEAEMLTREHERYLAFFDNAPDAYVVTDCGGSIREANRAALELFGRSDAQIKGCSLARFIAKDDEVAFLMCLAARPTALGPASWSGHIGGENAPPVRVLMGVRPIPLAGSGVAGLCWVVRPVD